MSNFFLGNGEKLWEEDEYKKSSLIYLKKL